MIVRQALSRDGPDQEPRSVAHQRGAAAGTAVGPTVAPRRASRVIADGAGAGLAAGTIFLLFEMGAMPLTGNPWAIPLGLMASILVGQEAMSSGYPITTAVVVGLVAHVAVSVLWGTVFAWIAAGMRLRSQPQMLFAGVVFGFAVWLIDFFLVTLVAWPWFREANSVVQLISHTLFYGLPLGGVLGILWQRRWRRRVPG